MEKNSSSSNILKVVIIGPECSGKTTLAKALAAHYETKWVPEYARDYIDKLDRLYHQMDLDKIALGQIKNEDELVNNSNSPLIIDTDLLVVKVWSEYKFGNVSETILKLLEQRSYNLYLLTKPNIPWEDDPQREHPNKRDYFYKLYKKELDSRKANYIEVEGNLKERLTHSITVISEELNALID